MTAPIVRMSVVPTPIQHTAAPSAPNRAERRLTGQKLPNLVPNPQLRVQPNLLQRWQPSLQPSLQLESPFLWPLLHVQLLGAKYSRQKKWHTKPVSE